MHPRREKGSGAGFGATWWLLLLWVVLGAFIVVGPDMIWAPASNSFEQTLAGDAQLRLHVAKRTEEIAGEFRYRPDHAMFGGNIELATTAHVGRVRDVLYNFAELMPADSPEYRRAREVADDIVRRSYKYHKHVDASCMSESDCGAHMFDDHASEKYLARELERRPSLIPENVLLACSDKRLRTGGGYALCTMAQVKKGDDREQLIIESPPKLAHGVLFFYLLGIPFALSIFWLRMRQNQLRMHDQVVARADDLVFATIVWPAALVAEFPLWTPVTSLKTRVAARYAELNATDMPLLQQVCACAAVVAGVVLSSIVPHDAGAQAPVAVHGFIDAKVTHTGSAGVHHAWLQIVGPIADGAGVDMAFDPASKAVPVRQASASFSLGDGYSMRVGQLTTSCAFLFDPPHKEKIGGGSGVGAFVSFIEPGIELARTFAGVTARASILSGSGPGKTDANAAKDGMLSVSWRPSTHVFEATVQSGEQPDGLRTRVFGHGRTTFAGSGAMLDVAIGYQRWHGADDWGVSALAVVPLHEHVETAVAYDALRISGTAGKLTTPIEHVGRVQATVIAFTQTVRAALMGRWSSQTGWGGDARMQLAF